MLLGQPETNLVIAGKAVRVLEFFLQCRQGRRGDALAEGRARDLIVEHLVDPTLGVGLKPRRDTRTMDAEEVRNVLAVGGPSARCQLERLQTLALFSVFLLFQALVQGVSTFSNGRHPFPQLGSPPAAP